MKKKKPHQKPAVKARIRPPAEVFVPTLGLRGKWVVDVVPQMLKLLKQYAEDFLCRCGRHDCPDEKAGRELDRAARALIAEVEGK